MPPDIPDLHRRYARSSSDPQYLGCPEQRPPDGRDRRPGRTFLKPVPFHGNDELKALAVSSARSSDDRHSSCPDRCHVPVRKLRCIQRDGT